MTPSEAIAWSRRDVLIAVAVVLIASSLSPFALSDAGLFPRQVFYVALMPVLALYALLGRSPRINPCIALVFAIEIAMLLLTTMAVGREGAAGQIKTMLTLASVVIVSMLFSSRILDVRVFAHVAVGATIVVLAGAAVAFVLAYAGYLEPVPAFNRAGADVVVYRAGPTLVAEFYSRGAGYFIRPGGVFIESGQLGMYASLAVLANATILRNRVYELLLIVLGFFSTSLAFSVFVLVFLVLFKRRLGVMLYVGAVVAIVVVAGGRALVNEDLLLSQMIGRLVGFFTETFGGNRAGATQTVAAHLSEMRWLGPSASPVFLQVDADATIFGPMIVYGLLPGPFLYLHVVMFAVIPALMVLRRFPQRTVSTHMPAVFILLAMNLFQRPYTVHFLYCVYLVAIFEWEWRKYKAPAPASPLAAAC